MHNQATFPTARLLAYGRKYPKSLAPRTIRSIVWESVRNAMVSKSPLT